MTATPPELVTATPVADPIVATAVLLLLHVPPSDPSLNDVVTPAHTLVVPAIDAGIGLTVIGVAARHPVANW